ncbi:hypothetical protein B0O80DRAFT_493043 [Mortierella sp. GBAus27b]|nr:hypothetical protein B0O80DRAFT_493043 [Mortierella sp. GBAus27b]
MSHSTRAELFSQGQDLSTEAALQQVTTERNSLRSQNDQLWKIIEKQRSIIQNLQKDVAKLTTERDLLRHHLAGENEHVRSNSLTLAQVNGHQRKRSMDKKAQESETTTPTEPATGVNGDTTDNKLALMSATSPTSSVDSRASPTDQAPLPKKSEAQPPKVSQDFNSTTVVHDDGDLDDDDGKEDLMNEGRPSLSLDDEVESQASYDPEIQVATAVNRAMHQTASAASPLVVDRDTRTISSRSDSAQNLSGQNQSPVVGSPTSARNISASLTLGPFTSQQPHLPPRSPRRERRDMGDPPSPAGSDNEDEAYPGSPSQRRKPSKYAVEQPSPLSQAQSGAQDQESYVMAASKVSIRSAGAFESSTTDSELMQPPRAPFMGGTRKNLSAQIPMITPSMLSQASVAPEQNSPISMPIAMSPSASMGATAIIDQDAEKFRLYMSRATNPSRKNISAPIQVGGEPVEVVWDHATALGQAVALENIQNQLDIQNQLLGQIQGHGAKSALNPVLGASRNVAESLTPIENMDYGRTSGDGIEQGTFTTDAMDPCDNRNKKRESTVPTTDDYPRISARTTSQQRDDDDSSSGHGVIPILPKRYDSQPLYDQSDSRGRVASPTPSGNSSVSSTLVGIPPSSTHSRSAPTAAQQAFSMFADNLEFVSVLIVGSNISTTDRGKEQLTFLISIGQEVQGESEEMMFPHREEDELWRVEKQYADFVSLDSKLRMTQSRNIVNSLPKLPDKNLFSTNAPSKVDARKVALEQYLQQVTALRIKDTRDICEFLSTSVVEREKRRDDRGPGWKEGYLTKRGKNFGGWKTRYFMLRGPVLEYFDGKDGHHLGSIALTHAQIGRQQSQDRPQEGAGDCAKELATDPNSYRHAFLILEPKKGQTVIDAKKNPNNVTRHVLCAETDQDRDDWVDALMVYVGKDPSEIPDAGERSGRKMPEIQKLSATPIKDLQSMKGNEKLLLNQEAYERQQRSIPTSLSTPHLHSQGRNGGGIPQSPTSQAMNMEERHSGERMPGEGPYSPSPKSSNPQQPLPRNPSSQSLVQDDGIFKPSPEYPYTPPMDAAERKQKSRMTFWPKKNTKEEPLPVVPSSGSAQGVLPPSTSTPPPQDSSRLRTFLGKSNNNSTNANTGNYNGSLSTPNLPGQLQANAGSQPSLPPIKQVFGVSLEQAIEEAQVQPGYELPAVVYRCIEYLNYHKAKLEEGIYRLNGSAAVIKSLKERFNYEGDVPLLEEEEYYDIHAVAGLLKLFLRDLPSSVLTRELHKEFLQVVELPNREDRVEELTRLVDTLPEANYTILRALTAHLIEIVENADVNKMTARNVGIVFSPTLGIPAGVFALLMSDFDQIFHTDDGRIMPLENSDGYEHRITAESLDLNLMST